MFKVNDKLQNTVPSLIQESKQTCDRNLMVTLSYYHSISCLVAFFFLHMSNFTKYLRMALCKLLT